VMQGEKSKTRFSCCCRSTRWWCGIVSSLLSAWFSFRWHSTKLFRHPKQTIFLPSCSSYGPFSASNLPSTGTIRSPLLLLRLMMREKPNYYQAQRRTKRERPTCQRMTVLLLQKNPLCAQNGDVFHEGLFQSGRSGRQK